MCKRRLADMFLGRFSGSSTPTKQDEIVHSSLASAASADEVTEIPMSKRRGSISRFESHIWTEILPDNEHIRFFKSANWDSSPLGPLKNWGIGLRLHVSSLLSDSRPAVIYWYGSPSFALSNCQN